MRRKNYCLGYCTIKVQTDGTLRYSHPFCGIKGGTNWSMLCEVGQPWMKTFEAIIRNNELNIEFGVDLHYKPWCADRIKEFAK